MTEVPAILRTFTSQFREFFQLFLKWVTSFGQPGLFLSKMLVGPRWNLAVQYIMNVQILKFCFHLFFFFNKYSIIHFLQKIIIIV